MLNRKDRKEEKGCPQISRPKLADGKAEPAPAGRRQNGNMQIARTVYEFTKDKSGL
jgi:hypothetical protein